VTTIWKFPVPIEDCFELSMPAGARLLSVQCQHGEPQLWALVEPDAPGECRRFYVAGTGHLRGDLDGATYVGTFQSSDGFLVFHLFEGKP
jgi:hypothetical protein